MNKAYFKSSPPLYANTNITNMKMNTTWLQFSLILLLFSGELYSQINPFEGGILSQAYSKELTEYRSKEFIIREILEVPDRSIIDLEIDALTASASGEITTIIYNCKSSNVKGLLFVFWSDRVNEFSLRYKGYSFKNLDYRVAKDLLDNLDSVLEEKKAIMSYENENLSKNAVYKWDDLYFLFYKGSSGSNLIRVFWNEYDAGWNQANLKTLKRRFDKYFFTTK